MTHAAFSAAQLHAVMAGDGPAALIAGPGCGKTTTLAGRIAHLVGERGVDPSSVLMVSFTTEAARRLRHEVEVQLGDRAGDVSIMTLHALGRRVIDTWSGTLGYLERPTVLHQDESRALLASAADTLGWNLDSVEVSELAADVDRCRLIPDALVREQEPLAPLASLYEERLRRHGAIDFVAMLSLPLRLFLQDEQSLRVLQDGYAWVLADEVQDFDQTEWQLVELLAERHGNLLVAGDDSQCLYRFRGADPRALEHFVARHPSSSVICLDRNYRSTSRLVRLCNAVAELLDDREPLWTDNPDGPMPRLVLAEDEHAEAASVAQQVGSLLDRGLIPHPGEAAVIFRTRAQADVVAGAFREAGLPYRVHGHPDLFGSRVVRDLLAYLRLAVNPHDAPALLRVIDLPPRGLASCAAALVEEPATLTELPARAAEFGPDAVAAAAALMATIYDLHARHRHGLAPVHLLDRALDRSGYRLWLEHHPDGTRRLQLLGRLLSMLDQLDSGLAEWLDRAALGDAIGPADDEAVRLTSVHGAKGHEFRATFAIGVEEGLLPHYRAIAADESGADADALREELRALYVAVTRGRERLWISACRHRSRGGRAEARQPSRWLHALSADLIATA